MKATLGALMCLGLAAVPSLVFAGAVGSSGAETAGVESRILLPELKGLRLASVAPPGAERAGGMAGVSVDVPDAPAPNGLKARLRPFIGAPFRQGDLKRISAVVVAWYREHHVPFVSVTFPEQDLSAGVLTAQVTEFHVGKIAVTGNRFFSTASIRQGVRLKPGDRIDRARLDADIAGLNESPFRTVDVIAERSATPGATDITLRTHDRFPLRVEAGFDNNGVPALGRARWSAGLTWGDAFGSGQQLAYRYTSSQGFWHWPYGLRLRPGGATLAAHSLTDTIVLPWRDRVVIFGAYDQVRPELGLDFAQTGVDWQTGLRYVKPIALRGWPKQELQVGFDFKRTNNNLRFGGELVSNAAVDTAQFVVSYGLVARDRFGQTAFSNRFVYSPGGLTSGDTDAAYQPAIDHSGTPFAHARYVYDDATLNRVTRLPFGASALTRIEGQIASANLLGSERLAAGGVDSLRGYDAYAASGSLGVLASQELRTPAFAPLKRLSRGKVPDQLQFDMFGDIASVWERESIPGQSAGATLASAGLGLRYAVGRGLNLALDYGWRLRRTPGQADLGDRLQLTVTVGN